MRRNTAKGGQQCDSANPVELSVMAKARQDYIVKELLYQSEKTMPSIRKTALSMRKTVVSIRKSLVPIKKILVLIKNLVVVSWMGRV